ncbi:MAG: hypothetical protein HY778_01250 [Betaproteobacteria bacterium]|nr:hypothetical protein [Betaproteobacteria bacterium]
MSESKKRKVHSAQFKAKVGMEALRGLKTLNEIGQRTESAASMLREVRS